MWSKMAENRGLQVSDPMKLCQSVLSKALIFVHSIVAYNNGYFLVGLDFQINQA